jgi:hypothetical protein
MKFKIYMTLAQVLFSLQLWHRFYSVCNFCTGSIQSVTLARAFVCLDPANGRSLMSLITGNEVKKTQAKAL